MDINCKYVFSDVPQVSVVRLFYFLYSCFSLLHRVLDNYSQIDSSHTVFGAVDTGKDWNSQVCPRTIGDINTCHKMRHSMSLSAVTDIYV